MIGCGKLEQRAITIVFVDQAGVPARVDGIPATVTSDPAVAAFDVAADGLSGTLRGVGAGSCVLRTVGDADLGAGVVPVVIEETVEITEAGQAAGGSFIAGPAVPQPQP